MGWWSTDIFGGDEPCDIQSIFYVDFLKLNKVDEDGERIDYLDLSKAERFKLIKKKKVSKLMSFPKYYLLRGDEKSIVHQVLASELMWSGITISKKFKKILINEIKKDEWSKENPDRKRVINNFIKKIQRY